MSAQSVQLDSGASSQSSDSGPGVLDLFQLVSSLEKTKTKKQSVQGMEISIYPSNRSSDSLGEEGVTKKLIFLPNTSKLDWVIDDICEEFLFQISIPHIDVVLVTQLQLGCLLPLQQPELRLQYRGLAHILLKKICNFQLYMQ